MSAVEDRCPSGNEYLSFQNGTSDMGVRTDQTVIANRTGVTPGCADCGVLHHDTFLSNPN
jgi:hypothetical protein